MMGLISWLKEREREGDRVSLTLRNTQTGLKYAEYDENNVNEKHRKHDREISIAFGSD